MSKLAFGFEDGGPHSQNFFCGKERKCHGFLRGDEVNTLVWIALAETLKFPGLILEQYRQQEQRELEDSKMTRDYIVYYEEHIHEFEEQRSKVVD